MGNGAQAGVALAGVVAVLVAGSTLPALAQPKQLSDESVKCLMSYAWDFTPQKFTTPTGKIIEVDKTKRKDIIVSLDVAREVTKVARFSAYAEMCDLPEELGANYRTLMAREEAKKQWSEQQMLYISQLHLITLKLLTGKLEAVDKASGVKSKPGEAIEICDGITIKSKPAPAGGANICKDETRQKVRDAIMSYVKADPAAGQPASKRAEPVPTSQKK
jgi:hypothetical protein